MNSLLKLKFGIAIGALALFLPLIFVYAEIPSEERGSDIFTAPAPAPAGGRAFGSIPGGGRTQVIELPNPLKATNFAELINRLTNWLLVIGAPILVLMIIIGAFQIMTGAGNPENITKGRHTITWAIIGYALLLISSGITLIIKQLLGVQ